MEQKDLLTNNWYHIRATGESGNGDDYYFKPQVNGSGMSHYYFSLRGIWKSTGDLTQDNRAFRNNQYSLLSREGSMWAEEVMKSNSYNNYNNKEDLFAQNIKQELRLSPIF